MLHIIELVSPNQWFETGYGGTFSAKQCVMKNEKTGVEDMPSEWRRWSGVLLEDAYHRIDILAEGIQGLRESAGQRFDELHHIIQRLEKHLLKVEVSIWDLKRKKL